MARKPGNTRDATRAAILAAAEKVFERHGFAGTSLSEIAETAGVTKSLIHYHFSSKDKLWLEIKESRFDDYAEQQRAILATRASAREFVRDSFIAYFTFLQKNPSFLRLMLWAQAEHARPQRAGDDDAVSDSMRSLVTDGIRMVHQMQERDELRRDIPARFMFAAFLSLLRHWFLARRDFVLVDRVEDPAEMDRQYLEAVIGVFCDGVIPHR